MTKRTGPERTRPGAAPSLGRPTLTASVEPLIVGRQPDTATPSEALPEIIDVRDASTAAGPLHEVPVDQVAANPLNERTDYRKVTEIAASMRERGQLTACMVVDREVFLAIYPLGEMAEVAGRVIEPAAVIGSARWIIVAGSTRRLAVIENGASLPPGEQAQLRIDVQNQHAKTQLDFLMGTWAENAEREDPNPIEDARLIAQIAQNVGSATAAGRVLGFKNPATEASQRLSLLKLSDQMQQLIADRVIPYGVARALAPKIKDLPPEQQMARWKAEERKRIAAAGVDETAGAGEDQEAPRPKPRRWTITESQTPQDVAGVIRGMFTGDDLQAFIAALKE